MIPKFPDWKSLKLTDQEAVKTLTSTFPPYSDFDFVSLWSWDTQRATQISQLNGNLAICLPDYISGIPIYSFIGTNKLIETIESLLTSCEKNQQTALSLLPADNFTTADVHTLQTAYILSLDRDNYDYILDTQRIARMEGRALHQKRKLIHRFEKNFIYEIGTPDLSDSTTQHALLDIYNMWERNKQYSFEDGKNEREAFTRFFDGVSMFQSVVLCIYIQKILIGFSIFEQIRPDYAMCAFQKGNTEYKGIYEMLNYKTAQYLDVRGCKYMNIEQDLGKPGLRRSKMDYDPTFFLKYRLTRKEQL